MTPTNRWCTTRNADRFEVIRPVQGGGYVMAGSFDAEDAAKALARILTLLDAEHLPDAAEKLRKRMNTMASVALAEAGREWRLR